MSTPTFRTLAVGTSLVIVLAVGSANIALAGGTLYLGSESQQTALGIFTTNGPTVTSQTQVATAGYVFNGVGEGAGLTGIVTGDLSSGDFNTRNLAGGLTGSFLHATPGTLNEDFAGNGTELWRANSNNPPTIYKLDPTNGSTLQTHILQGISQVVGLTFVGSQLWASDFAAGTVGTVNTTLDTYTPVFSAFASTTLGGLAYDSAHGVLWVGSFDVIRPYSTAGAVLGPDVSTTAVYPGFIDGLAFIVPEPSSLVIAMTAFGGFFGLMAIRRSRKR